MLPSYVLLWQSNKFGHWTTTVSAKKILALSVTNCRYMRGRLTLEKVNAAINDMATYAEANAQLITAPRKKVLISLSF